METHLADCAACRAEAVAIRRLMEAADSETGGSRARWLRWTVPAALAAAAVAGILLIAPGTRNPEVHQGPTLRTDGAGTPTLEPVAPAGPVASPDSVLFVWRPSGEDVSYRITVMDEAGEVLWQAPVEDTSAVLPDTVALEPGTLYYWYVDGLLELGRTASSGIQEFMLSR